MTSNPAIISRLDFLRQVREDRWDDIAQYRDYADGDQETHLTDDMKILLVGADDNGNPNSDPEFAINVCGIILDSKVERLKVRAIRVTIPDEQPQGSEAPDAPQDSSEETAGTDGAQSAPQSDMAQDADQAVDTTQQTESERVTELVAEWWDTCGLEESEENVYFAAARDGDTYTITEYNADDQRPDVVLNWTYAENDKGDRTGTEMAYLDGHPNKRLYATKRWTLQRPAKNNTRYNRARRLNVYFEDRVEQYRSKGMMGNSEQGWEPLPPDDEDFDADWAQQGVRLQDRYNQDYETTVIWNTDSGRPDGIPLGLAVEHFRNNAKGSEYGSSDIKPIVPGMQDAINRAGLSLDAATTLNGFKEVWVTGLFPDNTSSGKDAAIRREPGAIHWFESPDVATGQYGETNLDQLISVLDSFIVKAATLTSTPLSLFNLTAHTPAEGTQKQLESALIARVERAQRSFGASWARVVRYMLKLEAIYGERLPGVSVDQIDRWQIDVDWEPAATRNDKEEREIAVIDVQSLGVPVEFVWPRFYPAEQVAEMKKSQAVKSQQTKAQLAIMADAMNQQNEALQQQPPQVAQGQNGAGQNGTQQPANTAIA